MDSVIDTQMRFSENLVKISQQGTSELVILWRVKVKVKINVIGKVNIRVMVTVKFMDIVLDIQIRFPKNRVEIRQAGASE